MPPAWGLIDGGGDLVEQGQPPLWRQAGAVQQEIPDGLTAQRLDDGERQIVLGADFQDSGDTRVSACDP